MRAMTVIKYFNFLAIIFFLSMMGIGMWATLGISFLVEFYAFLVKYEH